MNKLFSLSVRYRELALADPVSTVSNAFRISKTSTTILQEVVKSENPVNVAGHDACCQMVINDWRKERASQEATHLEQLLQKMPVGPQCTLWHITKSMNK